MVSVLRPPRRLIGFNVSFSTPIDPVAVQLRRQAIAALEDERQMTGRDRCDLSVVQAISGAGHLRKFIWLGTTAQAQSLS